MRVSRDALPSAFIVLPVLLACAVTALAVVAAGAIAGLAVGVIAALASALLVEKPLKRLAAITDKIAGGDRYAIVPRQRPGPLSDIAKAVERLRATVLEADALAVDQRRREAEARLHMASRSFFPRRRRRPRHPSVHRAVGRRYWRLTRGQHAGHGRSRFRRRDHAGARVRRQY